MSSSRSGSWEEFSAFFFSKIAGRSTLNTKNSTVDFNAFTVTFTSIYGHHVFQCSIMKRAHLNLNQSERSY